MRRRRLLAALSGITVGTAGCVGSSARPAQTTADEGPLRITDESFTAGDGSCTAGEGESEGRADVSFEAETVRVDGRLVTPTPCHGAALDATTLDGSTLVVAVRTTDPAAGACVQCLGEIPYDLTVRFTGGLPEAVRVEHDGETVATVRR
ncbi:MAG: hypothetical protein ABEJ43_09905 [Haloferacaceae archaeon]